MDGYMNWPIDWLVTSDDYYSEFQAKLVDSNQRDIKGNSLLHVAAQSRMNNSRIVQLLLDRGADVDSTNPDGHTPLHFAVSTRKRDTVTVLLEAGASVNSKDLMGITALHFSVSKSWALRLVPHLIIDNDTWIVEKLSSHPDICLDPVDQTGETPLLRAVKEQNIEAVRTLLKKGANLNLPDQNNQTPLHVALSLSHPGNNIAFSLLAKGAGIYSLDNSEQTAIDILVCNVRDGLTLSFATFCLYLIALRYHITESLTRKLDQIPDLRYFFMDCCIELRLMKKLVIYDNVTLHDFCLDCFQARVLKDPVREIYKPVVEILLCGFFQIYYDLILWNLSQSDLLAVLTETVGSVSAPDLVPLNFSRHTIMSIIQRHYYERFELKRRLSRFKHFILKKI